MPVTVILGPMFSSKTSSMINLASQYWSREGKKVLLITCDLDTRDPVKRISSHFKFYTDLESLFDIVTLNKNNLSSADVTGYDVVCIDETQFFTNLWETINTWNQMNKHIICSGLKADSDKKPFGEYLNLIALADRIIECKALCVGCNCNSCHPTAVHTRKKIVSDLIDIGADDKYEPVCGVHYNK